MSTRHPASFRDPSGFVFERDGVLLRQVQPVYGPVYDALNSSGLLRVLFDQRVLVEHEEVPLDWAHEPGAHKVLKPRPIELLSYPYEWSFSQLRAAALLTLKAQTLALDHGFVLKDASAYNVQFEGTAPILIDSISFEPYRTTSGWVAYAQFCRHFLAPLGLMAKVDVRLGQLSRVHIDGVPLDLASRLLPPSSWLRPSMAMHVHLHARAQSRFADTGRRAAARPGRGGSRLSVTPTGLRGLIDSLQRAVEKLQWQPSGRSWADYYDTCSYDAPALARKQSLVESWVDRVAPSNRRVIDLGANTGLFSRLLAAKGASVVAVDSDPAAVEYNYRRCLADGVARVLPLQVDLTNPSSGLGWAHDERAPFVQRAQGDVVLCLALVHHLAISNNVPLVRVAGFLAKLAPQLIVEFVPKQDEQVQRLLATRVDIFATYTQEGFEAAFKEYFDVEASEILPGSSRVLYLMRRR